MKTTLFRISLLGLLLWTSIVEKAAGVSLPALFSDHMVLQQQAEVTVWGWGRTGEEITVTGSWDQQPVKTKTSNLAKWQVTLKTPASGGPHTLTVQGYNTIVIRDVLLGEVWLCSGQSNMEWSARAGIDHGDREVAQANYPKIRFFSVAHRTADGPQVDVEGKWVVCTPETMRDFSAIGYFFGREIHRTLQSPVGLINSSWGGTPAEVWLNPQALAQNQELAASAATLTEVPWGPVLTGKAYHGMIAPLQPYKLAGALWYQGEGNTANAQTYHQLLPALIQNWRAEWQQEFPFYFVQIAPYNYGNNQSGVLVRDAQRRSLAVPRTGMVVVSDIGNIKNIHPTNKIDVGLRLANLALNQTYGKKDRPVSGPLYRDLKVEGTKIRISFDHAEQGLVSKSKTLTHFEVAGPDQKFVPATARIDGNTVVLQAKGVKQPVAVRFAWNNTAEPNLFNKAGLPASSFRTDDWPVQ